MPESAHGKGALAMGGLAAILASTLLPRSAGAGPVGLFRRTDWPSDRPGAVSADLHRRGHGFSVLCLPSHLSPHRLFGLAMCVCHRASAHGQQGDDGLRQRVFCVVSIATARLAAKTPHAKAR